MLIANGREDFRLNRFQGNGGFGNEFQNEKAGKGFLDRRNFARLHIEDDGLSGSNAAATKRVEMGGKRNTHDIEIDIGHFLKHVEIRSGNGTGAQLFCFCFDGCGVNGLACGVASIYRNIETVNVGLFKVGEMIGIILFNFGWIDVIGLVLELAIKGVGKHLHTGKFGFGLKILDDGGILVKVLLVSGG